MNVAESNVKRYYLVALLNKNKLWRIFVGSHDQLSTKISMASSSSILLNKKSTGLYMYNLH